MVRTQIYLSSQEHKELRTLAAQTGKKQSSLIRQALDNFLQNHQPVDRLGLLRQGAGLWKNRRDLPDFDRLRREWERP